MEELFRDVILPRIRDANAEDIDELVSLLIEYRQKSKSGPRARLPPSPIDASLDTTGWLRENQLVKRSDALGGAAHSASDSASSNLIGDGVARAKSRAIQHSQQHDRIARYDAEKKLKERAKFISAMLNSPPGNTGGAHPSYTASIGATMSEQRRTGGNPAAFRMRDKNVYSTVCASMVAFH